MTFPLKMSYELSLYDEPFSRYEFLVNLAIFAKIAIFRNFQKWYKSKIEALYGLISISGEKKYDHRGR